jgi:hypothetical protein
MPQFVFSVCLLVAVKLLLLSSSLSPRLAVVVNTAVLSEGNHWSLMHKMTYLVQADCISVRCTLSEQQVKSLLEVSDATPFRAHYFSTV